MAKPRKTPKAAESTSSAPAADAQPPATPPPPASDPRNPKLVERESTAALFAVLTGFLYFLGFAGFEIWPLSFIAFAPLLAALRGRSGWKALRLGWLAGSISMMGGFYWIVPMLRTFSGFPTALCILFSSLLWVGQGLILVAFTWMVTRADQRGIHRLFSVTAAHATVELGFPLLFPFYSSASLHNVPLLIQTADLGGPILVSAAQALCWAGLELALVSRRLVGTQAPGAPATLADVTRARLRALAPPVLFWAFAIAYGSYRIAEVDRENRTATPLRVAVVQENLGLIEKRNDPELALYRHLATTRRLEREGAELVVWSESAVSFFIPEGTRNIREALPPWNVHVPVLMGALSVRNDRLYNTAFMVDRDGTILGTYDKTYLLAFGEYIPLGETFPVFYRWSRNSGHFTAGSRNVGLPLPGHTSERPRTIAPLICYEDILPRFVRAFQRDTDTSLFAVILNDAWFGDTAEPWIHLALSKFRAVEHRRDFVRSANSGVSGFIDAAGRLVSNTRTFTREAPIATMHLRTRRTPYYYVGDWAAWLGLAFAVYMSFSRRGLRAGVHPKG